jgi:quercetin dioxygenase-like cupin family protein
MGRPLDDEEPPARRLWNTPVNEGRGVVLPVIVDRDDSCTSEEIVMNAIDQKRRTLLFGLGGLSISPVLAEGVSQAQAATPQGYVLGATEGEHLIHFRDHGQIFIKAGSATGSDNLALGTQQVTAGAGIPIHRHLQMDEAFYVLEGSGVFILNDVRHPFEKGATIFIPKNSWHGFANPDRELLLLWIMSPAGLDGFFRDTCSPPGVPPKQLTREQINEIARKYATEFR